MEVENIQDQKNNCKKDQIYKYYAEWPFTPKNFNSNIYLECLSQQNSIFQYFNKDLYEQDQGDEKQKSDQSLSDTNETQISNQMTLYKNITTNNELKLFPGLIITEDGVVRLNSVLHQVSFGYYQQQASSIEFKKNLDLININLTKHNQTPDAELISAIELIKYMPEQIYNEMVEQLSKHYIQNNIMKTKISQHDINNLLINEKDEEFERYNQSCFQYLQNYNQNNPHQMYTYQIGRINLITKEVEISKYGFSKTYLDFLGIDEASLFQIILRNKKFDLIQDKMNIIQQTLIGLASKCVQTSQQQFISTITTFDGFQIKLIQKKKYIPQQQIIYNSKYDSDKNSLCSLFKSDFLFTITELDIDLNDLQQLILYRQRIYQNHLSQDDFIKKELSLKFEDVEYSVQSEQFLEKYYLQNLDKLYSIQQKALYLNKFMKNTGYRYIMPNQQNNIQQQSFVSNQI